MDRKSFLNYLSGLGIAASIPLIANSSTKKPDNTLNISSTGSMIGYADKPIAKVKIGMIGIGNRGKTLLNMLEWMCVNNHAEIKALSDLLPTNIEQAKEINPYLNTQNFKSFTQNQDDWKNLCQLDLDLVIICTPWELHTPMALYAMNNGKHVASEVPIAYTIEDCWKLVQTAEKTKRHCLMMENCNYNSEELWVLNMIEQGVFGDVTHTEGAYIHDLRKHLLDDKYYVNQWRLEHHKNRDGNFYTTHGLGPIAHYLKINREDQFDYLTGMSSRELNLSKSAKELYGQDLKIACGDFHNTMIKTKKGKTILLQFDVHTGSPYSRINKVVGTKAVHDGYPSRLFIDEKELKYWGHNWLTDEQYNEYRELYTHPITKKLNTLAQDFKEGHGGMDFIMMHRLITCLNKGIALDNNVYDSVAWSAITPLSEQSVAQRSAPIDIPDFTNGAWKNTNELEIMRDV